MSSPTHAKRSSDTTPAPLSSGLVFLRARATFSSENRSLARFPFASRQRSRPISLLLFSATPSPAAHGGRSSRYSHGLLSSVARCPPSSWREWVLGKDNPNLRSLLRSATGSVHPEVLAHRLRELLTVDVTHCLREVSVPVLFLHGSRDTTIRPWAMRHVRSVRPDIVVRELPVAHLLLQLAPESAWAAIDSFVAKRVAA